MCVVARLFCLLKLKSNYAYFSLHVHTNPTYRDFVRGVFCLVKHDGLIDLLLIRLSYMILLIFKTIGNYMVFIISALSFHLYYF